MIHVEFCTQSFSEGGCRTKALFNEWELVSEYEGWNFDGSPLVGGVVIYLNSSSGIPAARTVQF